MTRIITHRLLQIWEDHDVLHPAQHGYRWRHGTDTAILRVLAATELAKLTGHAKTLLLSGLPESLCTRGSGFRKTYIMANGGRTYIWTPHMADHIDP